MQQKTVRFWEIDSLRGIAIIMMIIFHILYDLNYFDLFKIKMHSYPIFLFFIPFAMIFLLLVGVSLTLSYNRVKNKLTQNQLLKKYIFRGLKIFGLGILITIGTWLYLNEGFVIFGILHCIGLSIILAYPFIKQKTPCLIFGILFIILGLILRNFTFGFNWLLWLGLRPSDFYTVDYFPLLPWFGVVLIGIFLGNMFYSNYKRRFNLPDLSRYKMIRFFSFLGRHSLLIYLLHQPVIVGIIHLFLIF